MTDEEKYQKALDSMLRGGDFAYVTNKSLQELEGGLEYKQVVYVAGTQHYPVDPTDVYTHRLYMLVHKVVDDHVVPDGIWVVDPTSLKRYGKRVQKKLSRIFEKDFTSNETIN